MPSTGKDHAPHLLFGNPPEYFDNLIAEAETEARISGLIIGAACKYNI